MGFVLAATLSAQIEGGGKTLHSLDPWFGGGGPYQYLVAGTSDIDGDGAADFLIGYPGSNLHGNSSGAAALYSGATGLEIYSFSAGSYENLGSRPSPAGDVNGDGIEDVMFGATGHKNLAGDWVGAAFVYSGADGTLLHMVEGSQISYDFPTALSALGDLDGDGLDDILVGHASFDSGFQEMGRAWAISGATGQELYHLDGVQEDADFGFTLLPIGDFDADGVADFGVGAPKFDVSPNGDQGEVRFYSGAHGSFLHAIRGLGGGHQLGLSTEVLGDLDGDGVEEILTRQPSGPAFVAIRSLDDGAILRDHDQAAFGAYKSSQRPDAGVVGDLNGDGWPDYALTDNEYDPLPAHLVNAGTVLLHSGQDGSRFAALEGGVGNYGLGSYLSPLGDVDGDGVAEFLIGGSKVLVHSLESRLSSPTVAVSLAQGAVVDLEIDFPDVAAGLEYRVLMTVNGVQAQTFGVEVPLSMSSFLVESWFGSYPFPVHSGLGGFLDSAGDASASMQLPSLPVGLDGRSFWMAAVAYPPLQVPTYATAALRIRFIP